MVLLIDVKIFFIMKEKKDILIEVKENYTTIAVIDEKKKLKDVAFHSDSIEQKINNIYLGKVSRVEIGLQCAFVEYGDSKGAFIPFSEIHPDYYQIPKEDREKLKSIMESERNSKDQNKVEKSEELTIDTGFDENNQLDTKLESKSSENDFKIYSSSEDFGDSKVDSDKYETDKIYSIQEVIKKGQLLLFQVKREERGDKGVSGSTYIDLLSVYFIFSPNCASSKNNKSNIRISKKINNKEKRAKIEKFAESIAMPEGMGLVVRTSAQDASEEELYNDYIYITNLWNEIRNKTINSKAMSLIYRECDVIKQIIRNYYDKNSSIFVNSDEKFYQEVLNFVKLTTQSKNDSDLNVNHYKNTKISLFAHHKIDKYIDMMFSNKVLLPSGGYINIDTTEAMVTIDVNSGKMTSSKNVEETALKTNLEAAKEIANQVKYRNLGGLMVIDFVDMRSMENRNKIKDEISKYLYKNSNIRVNIAKISSFGLMEISMQRSGMSVFDMITEKCPCCKGSGRIRVENVIAERAINILETLIAKQKLTDVEILCSNIITQQINSNKRIQDSLKNIEVDGCKVKLKVAHSFNDSKVTIFNTAGKEKITILDQDNIANYFEIEAVKQSEKRKSTIIELVKKSFSILKSKLNKTSFSKKKNHRQNKNKKNGYKGKKR